MQSFFGTWGESAAIEKMLLLLLHPVAPCLKRFVSVSRTRALARLTEAPHVGLRPSLILSVMYYFSSIHPRMLKVTSGSEEGAILAGSMNSSFSSPD